MLLTFRSQAGSCANSSKWISVSCGIWLDLSKLPSLGLLRRQSILLEHLLQTSSADCSSPSLDDVLGEAYVFPTALWGYGYFLEFLVQSHLVSTLVSSIQYRGPVSDTEADSGAGGCIHLSAPPHPRRHSRLLQDGNRRTGGVRGQALSSDFTAGIFWVWLMETRANFPSWGTQWAPQTHHGRRHMRLPDV